MEIGERVISLLKENNNKPEELAQHIGITKKAVEKWQERPSDPSAKYIARIADFFNITCEYLLTGIDKKGMEGESQMLTTMQQSAMAKLLKLNDSGVLMLNGYLDGLLAHDDFQSELAG
jgi:transcriptional regulator with XRE-family HTH domain